MDMSKVYRVTKLLLWYVLEEVGCTETRLVVRWINDFMKAKCSSNDADQKERQTAKKKSKQGSNLNLNFSNLYCGLVLER